MYSYTYIDAEFADEPKVSSSQVLPSLFFRNAQNTI
jgi:hypothetical protein